jgi:hypothetical protein
MLGCKNFTSADFAIGLAPQCRDLCQISCIRFLPIRYRQISSAIAGIALYSRFAGHSGGAQLRGRGGRVRPSPGQPRRFSRATIKRSLRVGTCVRYNYYVQLVAIWRARVPKRNNIFLEGGWKLVVHIAVRDQGIVYNSSRCYLSFPFLFFSFRFLFIDNPIV